MREYSARSRQETDFGPPSKLVTDFDLPAVLKAYDQCKDVKGRLTNEELLKYIFVTPQERLLYECLIEIPKKEERFNGMSRTQFEYQLYNKPYVSNTTYVDMKDFYSVSECETKYKTNKTLKKLTTVNPRKGHPLVPYLANSVCDKRNIEFYRREVPCSVKLPVEIPPLPEVLQRKGDENSRSTEPAAVRTLRLLGKRTMGFMGDSMNHQMYDAFYEEVKCNFDPPPIFCSL